MTLSLFHPLLTTALSNLQLLRELKRQRLNVLETTCSWKSYAFYSRFPGSYDYTLSFWNVEALVEWLVPWVLLLKAGWDFRKVTIRLKANLILVLKGIYSQGLMALFAWATQNTRYMTISGRFSRNVVATQKRCNTCAGSQRVANTTTMMTSMRTTFLFVTSCRRCCSSIRWLPGACLNHSLRAAFT